MPARGDTVSETANAMPGPYTNYSYHSHGIWESCFPTQEISKRPKFLEE